MAENEQNRPESYFVSERELEAKPPPRLETGALKWLRDNLANSALNVVLTLIGIAIVWFSIVNLSTWVIRDANWFSVTANLRNFMLGRYEAEFEWRATLTLYFSVFAMGAAIAVWVRQIARVMTVSIITIILLVQLFPPIVNPMLDLPSWYTGAGTTEISINQTNETPIETIGFIGEADDAITIRLANDDIVSEEALADLNGFQSNVANLLRNLAGNRLEAIAENERLTSLVAEHEAALADEGVPVLTDTQYEAYLAEIEGFEVSDPIIDTYNLNQIPVRIEILDGETNDVLASGLLVTGEDVFEATLPEDGWYILRKYFEFPAETTTTDASDTSSDESSDDTASAESTETADADTEETTADDTETADAESDESAEAITEGVALLNVQGIYPSAKRESTSATAFTRRPDGFAIEGAEVSEPSFEGEEVPFVDIIRNQYRGDRPVGHYLRTYVSPFFTDIANYVSLMLIIGVLGYVANEVIRIQVSREAAGSMATWLLGSTPVLLWILINGMFFYTFMLWLVFASMMIFCYLLYKLIQSNGFSPIYAVAGGVAYIAIVAVLILSGPPTESAVIPDGFDFFRLLTVLPLVIDDGAVPRFLLWLGIIFIPFAIFAGRSAYIPGETVKTNIPALVITSVVLFMIGAGATAGIPLTIGSVTLPVTIETEWFLQPSDARNWGGLLLTIMLTVYGIIIAFPIGIALALGRRSDLPLIKYLCTAYIELVRGSPFITVLFFAQLFIPLLNPEFNQVPGSYRAIAATIAFSAAYLAENVRGGLQSLPPGQEEAAKALGLNPWQTVTLITMPQALRAVIPALVGQFISLFKDTTLVAIVGLIDLVGFVGAMVVQAEFIGTRLEGLLFISIIFFVVSYMMSYVSRLLEASGSGSTRRM
ncbi:MAG: amino acid ABC transporter permease [Chloroflexota bacterium]